MELIEKAEGYAKNKYKLNDKNHQWEHILAIMDRAMEIVINKENVNLEILKLAIIFHDIAYENYKTHVDASVLVAEKFLSENNYPQIKIGLVKEIMLDHSTPHRKIRGDAQTLEGKIIYDADKSIFITDKDTYDSYFKLLYLDRTKELVENQLK